MSRTEWGPNKVAVPLPKPPGVSLAVVTHYTHDKYHEHRMDVVKLCIQSMLDGANTLLGRELLIWDNGSTPEFKAMLARFSPDVFVQSVNVGAHNARRNLAEIARGDILCMTDDDILFHPDWLTLQLEVLQTYPNVGLVSGSPYRWAFEWGQTIIPDGAKVSSGHLIPEQFLRDACVSIGEDFDQKPGHDGQDTLLEYKGVKAWAHAHHMQFIGYRETVTPFLERSPYYLGNGRKFNVDVMNAGLLQLTTYRRTAVHIGNFIDESVQRINREWHGRMD